MISPTPQSIVLRNNVQHYRQLRCMTQQQLAAIVQASRQTIMNTEYGRTHPSLSLAFRIADALGVGITDLFRL